MLDQNHLTQCGHPPPGAWLIDGPDGITIGATIRGPLATFLVPFTVFYVIAAPAMLIGIGMWQGFDAMLNLALAGAVLCDVPLIAASIFSVLGRQEVRLRGVVADVFTGVGSLGWARPFDPASIIDVREVMSDVKVNGVPLPAIELVNGESLKFGAFFGTARRQFVIASLRHCLLGAPH